MPNNLEKKAAELAIPIINELDYELVDIEYKKEGGNWFLRYYIDKPDGITIDDCQIFSDRISTILDEADPIPQHYFLEVSSPGLDRPLKKDSDFERYKGYKVNVKLYKAINGIKNYSGQLLGLNDNEVIIQDNSNILKFKRDEIAIIRLDVEF
mgnify:CR=1 FL=1